MNEEELDELIRAGLLCHAAREVSALRAQSIPAPDLSTDYRRWERKFLSDPFKVAKRAARPTWQRFAYTAAAVLLALSLSFGALVAVSPTARAWVQRVMVQWFGEYASFEFVGDADQATGELGAWYPTWLPEGYELVEETKLNALATVRYQNKDGQEILLAYTSALDQAFFADNEHHALLPVVVNGDSAYLLYTVEDGYVSGLAWTDTTRNIGFYLGGFLTEDELIRIAESIS